MKYNPQKHNRKSIRLKEYDYSEEGLYFITIVTQNRTEIFGKIKNGEMILNPLGKIAQEEWIKNVEIRKNISLQEYIIMPNHMHGIIQINYSVEGVLQYAPTENKTLQYAPTENKTLQYTPTENDILKHAPTPTEKFKSPSQTIGAIIRGYKGATTKRIKELIYEENKIKNSSSSSSTGVLQYAPTGISTEISLSEIPTSENLTEINIDLSKSIWQKNYWEHIIRNKKSYQNISNYIKNNPLKWDEDKFHKK
ncbi:MAG TPA: hypothetical protein DDX39_08195 [Bacteroidales bacterium]|nr:MAG: hypothetical protein A2W98_14755 [Bacteroidetes bacterium GWF2_33_38]OFY75768.1 MAG: hypothetical protein A2265_10000 [Bacteroidetes bacterium RIFOXYA12_FULL_33_9]HBF88606.1 hypothetical protein [Bacteroidales bacterium]